MQAEHGFDAAEAPAPIGLGARVVGILASPRVTFERVVANPRWMGILALGVGMVAAMSTVLMSADFAEREILERQIASMEAFGVTVTDEIYDEMEERVEFTAYSTFGFTLVGIPFAYNLLSAIDLFHVWWVMILAIGLAVLWKRRPAPIAATLYGIHAGIALIIAVLRTNIGF